MYIQEKNMFLFESYFSAILKLMDLQLSDSNFRRHILLQYLLLFQYLKGQVKFKRWNYLSSIETYVHSFE